MTATSLSAIRDSACVTSVKVVAAGPVRFFSQLTMSSACRPAEDKACHSETKEPGGIKQTLVHVQKKSAIATIGDVLHLHIWRLDLHFRHTFYQFMHSFGTQNATLVC